MINIVCLKHGKLYDSSYVNKLYNMVQRHLKLPHRVVCFTDDATGINFNVECRKLPESTVFTGWWWKPYVFNKSHFDPSDVNMFIDLDMVIVGDMEPLFNYEVGKIVGMRDVIATLQPNVRKLGSAVVRWTGDYSFIWDKLLENPHVMKTMRGDQDWIWSLLQKEMELYPLEWIPSYKWGVRSHKELVKRNGIWNFDKVRDVELPEEAIILAFHGTPNPSDVNDPIIVQNWK